MTFEESLNQSLKKHPEWATYVHLCTIFQESGASRNEVRKAFLYYMPKEEYDKNEVNEMVDYLFKISNEVPE